VGLFPDELRLAITLALNACLGWAAYRFVRRWVEDRVQAVLDAFLLSYLLEYLIVCVLGITGVLSGGAIVIAGLLAAGCLFAASPGDRQPYLSARLNISIAAALVLLLSMIGSIIWASRFAPTIANDSLAYQLPAAVQWLQTGRLSLLPVWFFNPANSFSPLAGSTFVAWLMGPMGNDVLARFVEAPGLVFLFFATIQLARALGARFSVVALLGLTVAFARPFISQVVLAQDDLFLASFLVTTMVALSESRLRDRLGPWRLGVALGLLLATKSTASFSLPVIFLACDAPWRAGWRVKSHAIAGAIAAVLFLPWYLRNWICYGSPAFPFNTTLLGVHLFDGPLTILKSTRLNSLRGIIDTLTGTYYSLPAVLAVALLAIWLITAASSLVIGVRNTSVALRRACLLGPTLAIAIFISRSPAAEIRFVTPSIAVLIASIGVLYTSTTAAICLSLLLACVAFATSFHSGGLISLLPAMMLLTVLLAALLILQHVLHAFGRLVLAMLLLAVVAGWVFIEWPSYLETCRTEAVAAWSVPYGDIADGWDVIRAQTERGATIAYTNTFQVYPLYGFDLSRRLTYVPTRPGVHTFEQLPRMRAVIGEDVPGEVSRVTFEKSDRQTWLDNLRASGANYLFIAKLDLGDPTKPARPPEISYASSAHFELIFENSAVSIYRTPSAR
jgi:hypothetical protein